MTLIDTIAQAATYLDYTHLSDIDALKQYKVDLEYATYLEADTAYDACREAYVRLIELHGLEDDSILSLNHKYLVKG